MYKKKLIYLWFRLETKLLKEEDPFLKLIIASELTNDQELLPKLAKDVLEVAEKSVKIETDTRSTSQILEGLAMIMIPTTVESFLPKKQYFVESSDNDLCTSKIINFYLSKYCWTFYSLCKASDSSILIKKKKKIKQIII